MKKSTTKKSKKSNEYITYALPDTLMEIFGFKRVANQIAKPFKIMIDMDGVICNFDKAAKEAKLDHNVFKLIPGSYLNLKPISNAIKSVKKLISLEKKHNFEVWIATKPPTENYHAYSEKAAWIFKYLPELKSRIIITHNKGMLGDENDFLIDDYPQGSKAEEFSGTLIHFGKKIKDWNDVMTFFQSFLSKKL